MTSTTTHINQKPVVPAIRFKEFNSDWRKVKLGDLVVKVGSGVTPKGGSQVYTTNGILFIRSQNVNYNSLHLEDTTYIPERIHAKMNGSVVKPNDILLNITGASIGRSCVVPNKIKEANVNQHVCIIRFKKEENSPVFHQSFLSSYKGQKLVFQGQAGGGREGLNFQSIRSFKYSIPSLPEQQKIAAFLSAVDEKIRQLTRKKELLEQYKKGVMQKLFSQELRFKDEDGNDYPDWDWVGGNELFDNISDKNHNSDLPILAITQDQGAIPRDMIDYQMTVTEKSIASYKVVQVGDFVISLRTFQGGIEYSDYKGICSPAYIILRPSSQDVDRVFYKFYLKTSYYIKLLQKNLEGIRDGKMISYKYFSEIKLPFPSLLEQQKIADYLSAIDTKIASVNNQITQTQTFKKGLLQQMFV
jgi:type I restriction enzyme S subunit